MLGSSNSGGVVSGGTMLSTAKIGGVWWGKENFNVDRTRSEHNCKDSKNEKIKVSAELQIYHFCLLMLELKNL